MFRAVFSKPLRLEPGYFLCGVLQTNQSLDIFCATFSKYIKLEPGYVLYSDLLTAEAKAKQTANEECWCWCCGG